MIALLIELRERIKEIVPFFFQKELKTMVHFVYGSSGGNILAILEFGL